MIEALSVTSVLAGTAIAWMGARYPRHQRAMETLGGILLIAGFALLGCALEGIFANAGCVL